MKYEELPEDFREKINENIKELVGKFHRPAEETVLDDVDLRLLLKISRRTALEYRKNKNLVHYKIDNKIFYLLSDVLNFIKNAKGKEHSY